ncbi:hypothetical protein VC83_04501 [Pseudogymnoascus destructans]|uniref:Uncharacterized protein n=1 Tax=Pseudogymnoascus destructans TaxID=655981 RepID=A0A177AB01_9PEZI|nr:uncharacterized protein VC83_04501 [Pseudogymnoascus destructans]OAF59305.1 hypothetical protein VC83_04501 [Pseudogymnoascus destructans]
MRSKLIAAVLVAPALIGALPVATPDAKIVLNPDTFSPPQFAGRPMPAEHTSPHHFADGVTDEGLKRMMGSRDKKLATPKEEIIVHSYRPFADPTNGKEHGHFELFEGGRKVHSRGFRQEVRTADNTERPRPDDHHLGPKIGTPINARATDNTGGLPHPNGHLLPPKIGTPIDARAIDNTETRPYPDDHHPGPKTGTPINARAIDYTESISRPNGHLLPPKIGTPIDARAIDNTDRPRPNDHYLGPEIGTPINAKREKRKESDGLEIPVELPISSDYYPDEFDELEEMPLDLPIPSDYDYEEFDDLEEMPLDLPIRSDYDYEEFDDLEEMPVDLPIRSDYDYEEFDDLEEMPVDLPIRSDYDYEEFDDLEEMPVDLPIPSDYYPESSDHEDSRYIPATPGDRNSRRPGRLAGPPYPCARPLYFNVTGFNTTINGTAFNNTINGTIFNNTINRTAVNITSCFEEDTSDFEEPSEAWKKQVWGRKAREADARAKNPHVPALANPKAKSKPVSNIEEYASEHFDYLKDPFKTPSPFEQDKAWSEDLFKKLGKPRHSLYWAQRGVEDIEPPKREPGHEWPETRHPKDIVAETGFDQGDGWKTDYWQNGVWGQPRVPNGRKPYWTADGNPVY